MEGKHVVIAAAILIGIAVVLPGATSAQAPPDEKALLDQAQTAISAKKWQQAADALSALVIVDPRWSNFQNLGAAEFNLGRYEKAIAAYDKGIKIAQEDKDRDNIKSALGAMLTNKGNALLKLKRNNEAVAAFTKAAELAPNPGTAYFNLCATQFNLGAFEGAVAACEKAINADPTKADAYFIKGSALYGNGTLDKNNKYVVPPGTVEALQKYLKLAPNGGHVEDVRAMLGDLKGVVKP
jgi:tetratricopeptide (TPR) repeat protein